MQEPSRRGRGRPSKRKKRGSGGGRNKKAKTVVAPAVSAATVRERRRMQERLNTFAFQSPSPFQPKKVGRKPRMPDGDTVYVGGKAHTLVRGVSLGLWSSSQGECACCYARAPPVRGARKKVFMSDGSRIPKPRSAYNVCERWLCQDCHYNVWPLHLGGSKPLGMIYAQL